MIDAVGQTTTYAYDQPRPGHLDDRCPRQDHGLGVRRPRPPDQPGEPTDTPLNSVVWTYDGAGRIATRVADGITTTYTYDANGNKLTASDGTFTITSTYDRLNRVLTVDDEDAGTTADTTYTYSLTSPSWTDPTGTYSATLDKFERATAANDPVNATDFTTTYGADGQPLATTDPNGNSTALAYDRLGRLTSKNTTAAGPVNRALYAWTYNRAGQVLSETSTITGDPANGQIDFQYDPLARLTSSALAGTTTTYGWDKVPNRTSVKVGAGTAATTAFNAANRPTSGANPTAAYTSDDDGRLTARPNQTMTWDDLGRLTAVKNAAGTITLAAYTYDPLDRLRMVDYGAGVRTRIRYVGLTTSAAQLIDDAAGTVTRNIGNGWAGERLLDWTGTNSNIRIYGTNAHHDVTWLASSTGTVSQTLRYDPWGSPRSTVPTGYTPFRFQGSFYDATTDLSWVVTRWYAPALGTFISEDSLLGEAADPDSRHLYAYGEGEPLALWDPNGQVSTTGESSGYRFKTFDAVIDYMSVELKRNAWCCLGNLFWIPAPPFIAFDIWTTVDFFALVKRHSQWDYKWFLWRHVGAQSRTFWTYVRGWEDHPNDRLRSDVWGNINYGYAGRAHGFAIQDLRTFARGPFGGVRDKADDLGVNLGIELWRSYGKNMTRTRLRTAIVRYMWFFRNMPGDVVIR